MASRRLGDADDVVRLHIHRFRKGSVAGFFLLASEFYVCINFVTQVVLNATTLGHVLLDATKKQHNGAGAFKRKIGSALKALTDHDVLREWIHEQVSCLFLPVRFQVLRHYYAQVCDSVPHSNDAGREAEMER